MEIFENDDLAMSFSKMTIEAASKRHDRIKNPVDYLEVYKTVCRLESGDKDA